MTSKADDVDKIMEYLIRGEDAPPYLADGGISWPSPDELLDNFFSLEDGPLGLLDQPLPDFSLCSDQLGELPADLDTSPEVPGSSCSDSGLSTDHADLTDYDQQLSPFLIQNTCDDINTSQLLSPQYVSDAQGSPAYAGDVLCSPQYSTGESQNSSIYAADGQESPQYVEDFQNSPQSGGTVEIETLDLTPIQSQHENPMQKIVFKDTFQHSPARKRRSSLTPNTAIVQPKVQRATVTNAPVTVTSKPHLVVSGQPQKPIKVTNIQVINPQPRVFCKPNDNIGQRKVIRVAPMAGNPRSILLPVTIKDMKDLRSIKIINASDLKNSSSIKLAAANLLSQSKMQELKTERISAADFEYDSNNATMDDSMSDASDEDDWGVQPPPTVGTGGNKKTQYPRLLLTAEERKLLAKEGIKLPASYPLTKHEERELKRIRRKIRNKISAQDSRKRKKEYVDGLEDRVKQCSDENQTLMKRIKILQSQNQSLTAQLKRLQHVLSGGGGGSKSAQPATCLLVLLMSVALVALPSLREAERAPAHTGPHALAPAHTADDAPHHALHRALLSATPHKVSSEEVVVDDGEFNMEELLTFQKPHSDHDYQVRKLDGRAAALPPGYRDIPIDEDWPPNLKHRIKYHFDFDDGPDYLPIMKDDYSPLIKDESYENFHADLKPNKLDLLDSGGKMLEFGPMLQVAVKNEDIISEEISDHFDRNGTVRTLVVNGTLADM